MEEVRKRLLEQERAGVPTRLDKGIPDHRLPSRTGTVENALIGGSPKVDAKDLPNIRFHDRLTTGQLDHVTKGETAQKLKLNEQFKMLQQGDVARRLELEKHVHNMHPAGVVSATNIHNAGNVHLFDHGHAYYHGWVSPRYADHCFKYHYWGPAFFAGECWYPSWNPWVSWSWNVHCRPIWDPRPIWCRPVIYEPCPVWAYYEVPVWQPLPVAACGTWVDVPPAAVPQADYNLQLLAVRFVDPGHPEEKLGPRYRVWFRNNSAHAIAQPFNVVLLASNGDQLAANSPQAGVRVIAVEAGDTQSVDVRLPVDVYAMGDQRQGNPVPYSTLHVLVDADREVPETNRVDNGVRLAQAEILPVDPAAFEAQPQQAAPGGEILLAGEGFGPQPGQVLVHMGGLELEGEIRGWYDLGARVALPQLPLAAPAEAELIVVRGDGAAANPLKIVVDPKAAAAP
jgi:hypothetical protein